ncbi:multidrug efflux SMR transporter [Nesterenkonia sp. F]|uniref:DMT family transporter n=1 Tax=Nesterenkonia sp. F TaxID=795955 RepID=UPI000255CFFB|nr:SMR family transporter [Nesterenkonia sp. F]
MEWIVLAVSGGLEAVWATALGESDGLRRRRPTLLFIAALVLSMSGLAYGMTAIPAGAAYAVWVGIGAVLTIVIGVVRRSETLDVARTGLLTLLVVSLIGLKVVS